MQVIDVFIPGEAVLSQQSPRLVAPLRIAAVAGSAYVSGDLARLPFESSLQAQGSSLNVTLIADRWVDDLFEPSIFSAMVRGLTSDAVDSGTASGNRGWNEIVQPQLRPENLHRIDDTRIRWVIPQQPEFDILIEEKLSVRIPPLALRSQQQVIARWPLTIWVVLF